MGGSHWSTDERDYSRLYLTQWRGHEILLLREALQLVMEVKITAKCGECDSTLSQGTIRHLVAGPSGPCCGGLWREEMRPQYLCTLTWNYLPRAFSPLWGLGLVTFVPRHLGLGVVTPNMRPLAG